MKNDAVVEIAYETMLGDLMGLVVDELKAAPGAWHEMSEDEQRMALDRIERRCTAAAHDCARMIAAENRPAIPATVESVAFKNGVKAVLTLAAGPGAHLLADSTASGVLLVFPASDGAMGGVRPEPDPQQPSLDLPGESAEVGDDE